VFWFWADITPKDGLDVLLKRGVFGGVRAVFWNFLEFFGKVLKGVQKRW
jgi:hypothetical protein